MAKVQEYYENNKPEHYEEGPWVLCRMLGGDYRIERFNPDAVCSTYPVLDGDLAMLQAALRNFRLDPTTMRGSRETMGKVVDYLNQRRAS